MKKVLLVFLAFALIFTLTACGDKDKGTTDVTGTLEELMEQVYAGSATDLTEMSMDLTEINADNIEYLLGATDIDYQEGLASEPMMSSIAHSIVLVRVNEGADIEAIKTKIKNNVDGYKWICVGVEDKNIIVDNIGNLVILIMDDESQDFHDSFLKLAE